MPPKPPKPIKVTLGPAVAQHDEEPPNVPLSPVGRTPSGMIHYSSSIGLLPTRSMSAPTSPLFTPLASNANWADEMDNYDLKAGLFAKSWSIERDPVPAAAIGRSESGTISPLVRIQSEEYRRPPRFPPQYTEADLKSSWTGTPPETVPLPDGKAGSELEGVVVTANDPYTQNGQSKYVKREAPVWTDADEADDKLVKITCEFLEDRQINRWHGVLGGVLQVWCVMASRLRFDG